jgi:hypothetical protein
MYETCLPGKCAPELNTAMAGGAGFAGEGEDRLGKRAAFLLRQEGLASTDERLSVE